MFPFFKKKAAPDPISVFEEWVAPHTQRLFELALVLTRDETSAEDLTQETLLRAFRSFERFREGEPPMPWLVTILRNLFRDQLRSAHHRYDQPWDEQTELPESLAIESRADPLSLLEQDELARSLRSLIARLPPHYSAALVLVDLQEMAYEEAAASLGLNLSTLKTRVARGRAWLRQQVLREQQKMKHELSDHRTTSRRDDDR